MKKGLLKRTAAGLLVFAMMATTVVGNPVPVRAQSDVDTIISNMSVRDKITQKMMMDFRRWNDASKTPQDMTTLSSEVKGLLADYQFGSVILYAENIKTTEDTLKLTKDMQSAVMSKGGQPLLIATDQEGGKVYRLGSGTALPGNMALGATGDSKNAKTAGSIIGSELSAVGINTTLSPVVDVNNNANNPVIGLRSFSDDAKTVGEFGGQYIAGLNEHNIIGCAKHFPGHGDTATDSHTGLPEVDKSRSELNSNELKPYSIAIGKGIDMIMTAHILYPRLDNGTILSTKTGKEERIPATLSKKILTGVLRNDMKFNGVIVTDAMNMSGIAAAFSMGQATLEAFKAGADIVCMPVTGVTDRSKWVTQTETVISTVEEGIANGEYSEKDLDKSVKRILTLKKKKGILDYSAKNYSTDKALATVGSEKNREAERKLAAKAVTLIRNKNKALPCKVGKNGKILMLAPNENQKAQMVVGVNRAKKAGLVPKNAEVKVYKFGEEDCTVEGNVKEAIDWADIVVIISEVTNKAGMSFEKYTSAGPKAFTEYCSANGKKSFVMSVEKPYDVQLYPKADAVLAVFGNKGSGIDETQQLFEGGVTGSEEAYGPNIIAGVEVIFGTFGAGGKLPVNIPEFDSSEKTYTDKVVYKRGYGLKYDSLIGDVSGCTVKLSAKKFTYTGKAIKAKVTVSTKNGKKLKAGTDYTLKYASNKKVGNAKVTVKGKGNYSGQKTVTYKIMPKRAKLRSVYSGGGTLTIKMKGSPKKLGATHYQVAYKNKGVSKWKYKNSKKSTVRISGSRDYKVKVRAYKKVGGKKFYGKWSKQ